LLIIVLMLFATGSLSREVELIFLSLIFGMPILSAVALLFCQLEKSKDSREGTLDSVES
jgi:hypothetical protein